MSYLTQWPLERDARFGRDPRILTTGLKNVDKRNAGISAFHLEDEAAQRARGYWVALDRTGRRRIPWRFGAYVIPIEGPNVALVIEPRGGRYVVVQVAFEHIREMHDGVLGSDCRIPLERWVRLAAAAITVQAEVLADGNVVGKYAHEQGDLVLALDAHERARLSAVPTRRIELDPATMREIASTYRREMSEAASETRRPQPTSRIMAEFGVSKATAGRWVGRCRDRKLLGAALTSKAGEAPVPKD